MPSSAKAAEKIAVFRSLFRGREDVFARYWDNPGTGKSGYAPVRLPLDDAVLEDHLRGRHTIGVYPLLPDDSCWFLAADFDEAEWMDDVTAFVSTARESGLAPAVERSRSGNGAHVWFFFREPVRAQAARALGSQLIGRAIRRRHQIKLKSYDRLFPNQDILPKGGFGNLIVLPLQRVVAENGHTLFLDDQWNPFPDQWEFLRSISRSTRAEVDALTRDVAAATEFLNDKHEKAPEARAQLSFGTSATESLQNADYPDRISVVLDRTIQITIIGLPSALTAEIKILGAFANPEFFQKQRLRLSTHNTPRVINRTEITTTCIALPRGCLDALTKLLASRGIGLDVNDCRTEGAESDIRFLGSLTSDQSRAVESLAEKEAGVLVAPPGAGKTVMAIALMAKRGRSTLVLVHRKPLLDQWVARLSAFTGRPASEIGKIRSGKRSITGTLDVAMVQSLIGENGVDDIVASYGMVIVDECHHVAAVSIEKVLATARARYTLGLTATPKRRDGLHPIVHMQLGPVRYVVRSGLGPDWPIHKLIVRDTLFTAPADEIRIQTLYRLLAASEQRNDLVFDDILLALEEGRSSLVLTERRDHLE